MQSIILTVKNSYSFASKHFNAIPQKSQNKIIKAMCYYKKSSFGRFTSVELFHKKFVNESFQEYYQFPTGLVFRFMKLLKEYEVPFTINDMRGTKPDQIPVAEFYKHLRKVDPSKEERDYQKNAIELSLKVSRGIISHSTSAGKTIVIAGIIYCINQKTLILCTGKVHVNQLSADMEKYVGRRCTIISRGICDDRGPIVCANVQALHALMNKDGVRYKEIMHSFGMVISDEVHHLGAVTYTTPMYYCERAYHKYGFSGTVHREDGAIMEVVGAVGPIIDKIDYNFLTKEGYISPARFFIIDPNCECLLDEEDTWPACLDFGIVNNQKRNIIIRSICNTYTKRNSQVLVISPFRTKHGMVLEQIIPSSKFLYGESSEHERKKVLAEFADKKFKILLSSTIFDEVINLPNLHCVILAGGGKAHNSAYQRIGRGLRKAEGKDHVDIIIMWDSHSSILLDHSREVVRLIEEVDVWKNNIKRIGTIREQYEG